MHIYVYLTIHIKNFDYAHNCYLYKWIDAFHNIVRTKNYLGSVCLSNFKKGKGCGTSLVVQWLGLHPSTTRGMGSIPGWGTKILHDARHGQNNTNK